MELRSRVERLQEVGDVTRVERDLDLLAVVRDRQLDLRLPDVGGLTVQLQRPLGKREVDAAAFLVGHDLRLTDRGVERSNHHVDLGIERIGDDLAPVGEATLHELTRDRCPSTTHGNVVGVDGDVSFGLAIGQATLDQRHCLRWHDGRSRRLGGGANHLAIARNDGQPAAVGCGKRGSLGSEFDLYATECVTRALGVGGEDRAMNQLLQDAGLHHEVLFVLEGRDGREVGRVFDRQTELAVSAANPDRVGGDLQLDDIVGQLTQHRQDASGRQQGLTARIGFDFGQVAADADLTVVADQSGFATDNLQLDVLEDVLGRAAWHDSGDGLEGVGERSSLTGQLHG